MNRLGVFVITGLILFTAQIFGQSDGDRGMKDLIEKLKLTEKQNAEFEKMYAEMEKETIEVKERIKKAQIELERFFKGDDPKKIFIKSKLNEISELEVKLRLLRIELWFDFNDQLNVEQQKVWKKVLEAESRTGNKAPDIQKTPDGQKTKDRNKK